jgi:hypothetical protein
MIRDPSKFDVYAQQAADLEAKQEKLADQRELAVLEAQKAERDITGKALEVIEGRREKRAEAKFDRQSKLLAADIAARKPTDLKYYAEMTLKASQGDKEAQIIVAGINDYLQQSAIGRNIIAQQGVNVREKAIDVELIDKAVKYVDSQISMGGPEYTKFKNLQKQDKVNKNKGNPTTLAEDFKTEIETTYINRVQGQRQAKPSAAPAGGQKTSAKPSPAVGTVNGWVQVSKAVEIQAILIKLGKGLATYEAIGKNMLSRPRLKLMGS